MESTLSAGVERRSQSKTKQAKKGQTERDFTFDIVQAITDHHPLA
jgi:hypothetical protein